MFGTVLAVSFAPVLAYNDLRSGNPFVLGTSAPATDDQNGFAGDFGTGLYGLLVAQNHGLLVFAPWLVLGLAPVGLGGLSPRSRVAVRAFLIGAGAYTVLIAGLKQWAKVEWGPRYLVPILPVVIVPAAVAAYRLWRTRWRPLVAGLAVLSVAVTAPAGVVELFLRRHRFPRGLRTAHPLGTLIGSYHALVQGLTGAGRPGPRRFAATPSAPPGSASRTCGRRGCGNAAVFPGPPDWPSRWSCSAGWPRASSGASRSPGKVRRLRGKHDRGQPRGCHEPVAPDPGGDGRGRGRPQRFHARRRGCRWDHRGDRGRVSQHLSRRDHHADRTRKNQGASAGPGAGGGPGPGSSSACFLLCALLSRIHPADPRGPLRHRDLRDAAGGGRGVGPGEKEIILSVAPLFVVFLLMIAIVPIAKFTTHRVRRFALLWIGAAVGVDQIINSWWRNSFFTWT